jgi:integrase
MTRRVANSVPSQSSERSETGAKRIIRISRDIPEHVFRGFSIKVYASGGRHSAQFVDANRVRWRFEKASESLAVEAAKDKIRELTDGQGQQERLEEARAAELLRPIGMTVIEAARLCASLTARLKPHGATIEGSVNHYLQSCAAKPIAVQAVVHELLEIKERDTGFHNVKDLRARLENRFCIDFGKRPIGEITKAELNVWLDSLNMAGRSRRNYHSSLVTLFNFAKSRGYLPDDRPTAIERTVKPKAGKLPREIFEPDEMIAMLGAAQEAGTDVLAVLPIAGFAGVRSEELCHADPKKDRLRWEDINWAAEGGPEIHIRAEVAKTGEERFIPMTPNLQLWLKPFRGRKGPIFTNGRLEAAYASLSQACGVPWKKNALRRSYATYRAVASASINATVTELGNSEAMLKRHYRKAIPEATARAEKWFSITPAEVAKKR